MICGKKRLGIDWYSSVLNHQDIYSLIGKNAEIHI